VTNWRMRWTGHVARMGNRRGAYRALVRRPNWKILHGRPRCRGKDTKMDLQEVGWGAWTGMMWLRVGTGAGCCECGNESSSSIRCRGFFRLAEELLASQEAAPCSYGVSIFLG
jgi:hypothetical protein